jgi:hypothetical protein
VAIDAELIGRKDHGLILVTAMGRRLKPLDVRNDLRIKLNSWWKKTNVINDDSEVCPLNTKRRQRLRNEKYIVDESLKEIFRGLIIYTTQFFHPQGGYVG